MNDLYSWVMSRYPPYGRFKWLKNADNFNVNLIMKRVDIGYALEVDLEHPDELHVLHNDYPLALEKFAIPYVMLPDYCKNIAVKYEI